jgi:hypothetical protein
MRALILALALAIGSLGLVAMTPSTADAAWWGRGYYGSYYPGYYGGYYGGYRPYYSGYAYPGYYYPGYYYPSYGTYYYTYPSYYYYWRY